MTNYMFKDNNKDESRKMPIDRKGFYMILAGFGLMVLGYILLAGGGVKDPQVFNYDMFNFRRMAVAPVVMVAGIVTIIVAIVRKPKD